MPLIAPSILSADFLNLGSEIQMLNESAADWIHCDVMDGRFVPNISFGLPLIRAVKQLAKKPLDVHLMIVEPEKYIEDFIGAGADIICFHIEATVHVHRTIYSIKEKGLLAGLALNPHSPAILLTDIISDIDVVNIMSVNPGFGGQKFIAGTINKIYEIKNLILSKNSRARIEIDGGVSLNNVHAILEAGADILVAGNTVFSAENPDAVISQLKNTRTNTATA